MTRKTGLDDIGLEQARDDVAKTVLPACRAAPALHSGEIDADLDRLAELWPLLVSDDRSALLAHAEHLAALRGGATWERATCEISSR